MFLEDVLSFLNLTIAVYMLEKYNAEEIKSWIIYTKNLFGEYVFPLNPINNIQCDRKLNIEKQHVVLVRDLSY